MRKNTKGILLIILIVFSFLVLEISFVYSWSNGGYSDNSWQPDYGTHDWIAQHALDWLESDEKQYITNNLSAYLYGTELPDNPNPADGIADTVKHHVYFYSDGSLQDDSSAIRASEEYQKALNYLINDDFANAAKTAGVMSHYIVDVAVFGHVMGGSTVWGTETHHSDYENYVRDRTNSYASSYNSYLSFDQELTEISAYNATINLAWDTTFDMDGELTCAWMDTNYEWTNTVFVDRCGESLNLAVNLLADVLHTLYSEAYSAPSSTPTPTPTPNPTLSPSYTPTPKPQPTEEQPLTVYTILIAISLTVTGLIVFLLRKR